MNNLWDHVFLGNTLKDWGIAIGIIAVTLIGLRIAKQIVLSRLKKWSQRTNTKFDDFIISLINRYLVPFLYILGVYLGIKSLALSAKAARVTDVVVLVAATYFVIRLVASTLSFVINTYVGARAEDTGRVKQAKGIIVLAHIFVWIVGIIFLIDNLGYNITTIITGLGVGGIAIALASQAILGDLFSSFVIFFDKPFEIGDFIIVNDKMGTVEYVGIKTTRLRSLSGEQLIFSNTDLTNARIHNYKRMNTRRIVFSFRISYNTAPDKIRKIPEIVKGIIEAQPDTKFDRAHFLSFGDFSLNFEVVYIVQGADYNLYMDRQQAINLEMFNAFKKEGIGFAYPTQQLIFNNGNNGNGQNPYTNQPIATQTNS